MRQGRSHAPKLPSALLGAPTATTVSTPTVGVHRHRESAADGMSSRKKNSHDWPTGVVNNATPRLMGRCHAHRGAGCEMVGWWMDTDQCTFNVGCTKVALSLAIR